MTVVSRKAALASAGMAHLAGTGPVHCGPLRACAATPPQRPSTCRVPGCGRTIDPWTAFCGYHWHGLPTSFQDRLAAARKSTDPAALPEAIRAAVEHIEAEGRS